VNKVTGQRDIDGKNARFWDELCGSALAKRLGIKRITPSNLRRFDRAYMKKFPYLRRYLRNLRNKRVLEIGLGYGTMGQVIASKGTDYHAMDIAEGPARLMHSRLSRIYGEKQPKVQIASALNIPYKNGSFDYVYAIGCLHHTGNLKKSVMEVFRILKPKGETIVMLYNRHSLRYLAAVFNYFKNREFFKGKSLNEYVRGQYDDNSQREAAPYTDFTTRKEARHLFRKFARIKIEIHKVNPLPLSLFAGRIVIPKMQLTQKLMKAVGSDLYIRAIK
jgi:ubiquinone/menaquinone biosynthesis C-methylase UbiE